MDQITKHNRQKTVVLSLYVKGMYFGTVRRDESELEAWKEAFEGCAHFMLTEDCGIASYYRVDINKKPKLVEEN